jgi:Fe-S-cluster containining protein
MTPLPLISCDNCGACCEQMGLPPFTTVEYSTLPPSIAATMDTIVPEGSPCIWLENGRCKHYDHRPAVCREFEVGGIHCLVWRERHGMEANCQAHGEYR